MAATTGSCPRSRGATWRGGFRAHDGWSYPGPDTCWRQTRKPRWSTRSASTSICTRRSVPALPAGHPDEQLGRGGRRAPGVELAVEPVDVDDDPLRTSPAGEV